MGSSHSYLQNLEAAGTTPMYWMEEGLCVEVPVPDNKVHFVLSKGGVAGKCADTTFTQYDYSSDIPLPDHKKSSYAVW